ncbi:phage tail sheath subtilisin-like domain-containing protein [Merdimmobilis hominis]|uniref:phage tail sheath subtilisin-like domain-containing protein n=1 Tax=Merdimmobilis hominis TaxID=2897707 RepID=UPI003517C263
MGLPTIDIIFKTTAATAIQRSQKGVVGLILKDGNQAAQGAKRLTAASEVPEALGEDNRGYVERAFLGYVTPPRAVVLYTLDSTAENLEGALSYFATQEDVDYLCGPLDCTAQEAQAIAAWVKERRGEHSKVKAVLPNLAADQEGVVNFTTGGIQAGGKTYSTAAYCSRIAGLIAGTPMAISCTYAPLPEVTDVTRLSRAEMDAAVDAGEFLLYHDGQKVKVARGVNSLTTFLPEKGKEYQKIKIVETLDMISTDIRRTAEDGYIGKYANSYDNKLLLVTAVKSYLENLEAAGILAAGASQVGIDLAAQEAYLKGTGVDTSSMSEQEIKEALTGSKVMLETTIRPLDAIEDITIINHI